MEHRLGMTSPGTSPRTANGELQKVEYFLVTILEIQGTSVLAECSISLSHCLE
jgi:hypothetical protein